MCGSDSYRLDLTFLIYIFDFIVEQMATFFVLTYYKCVVFFADVSARLTRLCYINATRNLASRKIKKNRKKSNEEQQT